MNRYSLGINPRPNFKLEDHSILTVFHKCLFQN